MKQLERITLQGVVEKVNAYAVTVKQSNGGSSISIDYLGPPQLKVGDKVSFDVTTFAGNITIDGLALSS